MNKKKNIYLKTENKPLKLECSISGWMNLWGNLGAFVSPLLCGWLAEISSWHITFGVIVILVFLQLSYGCL
ncbi:peptide MFS transporter [Peribacillus butanolivorans]|nr:peptide MFS transporter [Peribacillus butanolivorans]